MQLVDVPLSPDYDHAKRSIGVSSSGRESKKKQLSEFIQNYNLSDKKLVEIGCGNGQFLEMFREIGAYNVAGLTTIDDACLFDYDCFFAFHYLEHIPAPVPFVGKLYKLIKPGGYGFIEVPNYDYIEKHGIWLEFTKDHRFYYRKTALSYLLLMCGFSIESIDDSSICLTVIVKKPQFYSLAKMGKHIDKDVGEFRALADGMGEFSIYGAGHYSRLLLNLSGTKPHRIFDSNPQKCGHKIGGVMVENGKNVADIGSDDNIIIICAIYNDEVGKMLSALGKKHIKWG